MSYQTRAYDNEHGDPVVVLVADGTHDVGRLAGLLASGNCEQSDLARTILRQVRRHNGGRAALQMLAAHGGPDLLHDVAKVEAEHEAEYLDVIAATRQMANDANAALRAKLLAALGIDDDGETPLAGYVDQLIAERDALMAALRLQATVIVRANEWRAQFEKPVQWPRQAALIAALDALNEQQASA
ncbi:hypothetical protein ABZ671_00530 [Micromonospora sp. NPDC006766]|uniref:hypothetical protein n=1 Tax=Micromonospora sp. NPDC006766 TaxID=3154778 RepID=UPI0033F97076